MHDQLTILSHPAKVRLFDMRPRNSFGDHGYCGLVNAKPLAEFFVALPLSYQLPNQHNISLLEFCTVIVRTILAMLASFAPHILRVVGVCAKPEMGRIATEGIVPARAVVAHKHVVGNRANIQQIANAVRVLILPLVPNLPVVAANSSAPLPTLIRAALIYFSPKTTFDGASVAMAANKANRLAKNVTVTFAILAREGRPLTAATMTITVRDFVRGIMEAHRNLSFLMPNPGTCSTTLPGVSIGLYSFNYTTLGRIEEELCTTI